jgi:recombination protein RecA
MAKEKNAIESIWDEMDKLYGSDGLERVGKVETIPSGSFTLDDALGQWGLPRGRIIQYAGRESSGKSLMSFMAIKEWQKLNPKNWALFIDAEYTYDEGWVRGFGVDTSEKRLKVWACNDGAKIFERLCGVPNKKDPRKSKEKLGLLDIVKKNGGADETGLGIIVLDSVAAIQPPLEMTSVSGKSNMALMARFLPPELRRLTPLLAETGVIFLAINQVRTDPGKMYGNPETTTGGQAWKHYCSIMANFAIVENKKDTEEANLIIGDEQIGHIVKARIDKNKVAPPKKSCEFNINYVKGVVDKNIEIARLSTKYGIVERPNNRTYICGDNKWTSKEIFHDALKDESLMNEIFLKVKSAKESGVVAVNTENEEGDSCNEWDEIISEKVGE